VGHTSLSLPLKNTFCGSAHPTWSQKDFQDCKFWTVTLTYISIGASAICFAFETQILIPQQLFDSTKSHSVQAFNVNPPEVFAKSHVPDGKKISFEEGAKDFPKDKKAPIAFYCVAAKKKKKK
jgi:hypothetical protein